MNTRCVVIGGGLIGLSIARKFSMEGMKTILLEANSDIGLETSYRNSAVIHAGLYYPTNSLKAKLCVRGKELLYEYCKLKNISHKKIGKLIVATSEEQLHDLANLYKQAISNGVNDVTLLTSDEVKKLEPNIKAVAGLLSPSTGILNGHQLMLAFESDIKQHGGRILCRSKVLKIEKVDNTFKINIDDFKEVVECELLVNAAGLWAQEVANNIQGLSKEYIPGIYYAKGNYFKYKMTESPFNRLIYPLPEKAGLGIHATIDMSNSVRFGPDVEWINNIDYSVNVHRKESFFKAIKNYFPAIKIENLEPEYAGIRPKSKPPNMQPQDFCLQSERDHGVANLINLFGIESPGLTSSMAIAEEVHQLINQPSLKSSCTIRAKI